jgi:hypothetical protein
MQERRTKMDDFNEQQSYEQITETEADFLMELYDAIIVLVGSGSKVSLPRIADIVGVRPTELMDYIHEITEMERQLNVDATE